MRGKAHLLCSSLSNFAPDETKPPCLLLLQGYVVVGNPASPKPRKSRPHLPSANKNFYAHVATSGSPSEPPSLSHPSQTNQPVASHPLPASRPPPPLHS